MDAIDDTIDVRRDAAELLGEFHGHDEAEVERQLDASAPSSRTPSARPVRTSGPCCRNAQAIP